MNTENTPSTSIPVLLRDLRDETTTLLRQEVALARTEIKENVSRLGAHAAHLAVGAFVAYAGVIVLLIGIGHLLGALLVRAGMNDQVAQWLAPAVVGLVVALIGWAMVSKARSDLTHDDLTPRQTIDSLRTNKTWVQGKLHHSS